MGNGERLHMDIRYVTVRIWSNDYMHLTVGWMQLEEVAVYGD